jgi:hypothetical protein
MLRFLQHNLHPRLVSRISGPEKQKQKTERLSGEPVSTIAFLPTFICGTLREEWA